MSKNAIFSFSFNCIDLCERDAHAWACFWARYGYFLFVGASGMVVFFLLRLSKLFGFCSVYGLAFFVEKLISTNICYAWTQPCRPGFL